MNPVVETVGLTHRYGRFTALQDVDLVIPEGSLYALMGPNGAGKTTLLKILLGLLPPTEGSVRLLVEAKRLGLSLQDVQEAVAKRWGDLFDELRLESGDDERAIRPVKETG